VGVFGVGVVGVGVVGSSLGSVGSAGVGSEGSRSPGFTEPPGALKRMQDHASLPTHRSGTARSRGRVPLGTASRYRTKSPTLAATRNAFVSHVPIHATGRGGANH